MGKYWIIITVIIIIMLFQGFPPPLCVLRRKIVYLLRFLYSDYQIHRVFIPFSFCPFLFNIVISALFSCLCLCLCLLKMLSSFKIWIKSDFGYSWICLFFGWFSIWDLNSEMKWRNPFLFYINFSFKIWIRSNELVLIEKVHNHN